MTDASLLKDVVDAVAAGGVRAIEITMTVPGAIALIEQLSASGIDGIVGPDLDLRLAAAGPATDAAAVKSTEQRVMTAIEDGVAGAMPAGILEGSNAQTVANFVARVAGQ